MAYYIVDRARINYTPTVTTTAAYGGLNTAGSFSTVINNQNFFISGSTSFAMPTPNISLNTNNENLEVFDWANNQADTAHTINIISQIICTIQDFPDDFFSNNDVYIEMVVFKRKSKKGNNLIHKSNYTVPSPHYVTTGYTYPVWGSSFWTRSGSHKIILASVSQDVNIDRPNHFVVSANTQQINLTPMLNGRYFLKDVAYRDSNGVQQLQNCLIPLSGYYKGGKNKPTNRFAYSPFYQRMYVAFRYVVFDPKANGNRGQIYSGPLSKTIKISPKVFPFQDDYNSNIIIGLPTCYIHPNYAANKFNLKANFETNVP